MASEATIAAIEADQKKLLDRITRMEDIMQRIFAAFVELFGDAVPNHLKEIGEEWAATRGLARQSSETPKVQCLDPLTVTPRVLYKTVVPTFHGYSFGIYFPCGFCW